MTDMIPHPRVTPVPPERSTAYFGWPSRLSPGNSPRIGMRRFTLALLSASGSHLPTDRRPNPGFDWEEWLNAVRRDELGGLLGHACLTDACFAANFPEEIQIQLARSYYAIAACNLRGARELAAVLKALHENGVPVLVLKGAHLAETVYPSPGCRPFRDTDLLVDPAGYSRAAETLEEMGYIAISRPDPSATPSVGVTLNSSLWGHPGSARPCLHLHWHLLNSGQPFGLVTAVDDRRLWADAECFNLEDTVACGVGAHHLLLHLAEHAVKHAYGRLILLADLAAVMGRHGKALRWATLLEDARAFGMLSSLSIALRLVQRYTAARVPPEVLHDLARVPLTFAERRFLSRFEADRTSPLWSYWIYASRCETWADRARFLGLTLRPRRDRLSLQLGGPARWSRYLAGSVRQLLRSLRA
ncbi:MAG: nucleotidyltransferase family protein [Acidobacteria bacterium]|nr:nucleotidyltransferase family protein [Acidobacteriota bacterium]